MPLSILRPKLYVPVLRKNAVKRSRLLALLDHSLKSGHRLSFILAPAGFGKTTLAIDWISQCNMPFAWLSLDAEDQKVSYFLSYVVAALQTINEGFGQSISKNLVTSTPIESVLTALVNEIANFPQNFILEN